jgi:crotonobetainyl-CoA:carnitine CoA-transferase CaiB-like acyl-CoA transferase
MKLLGNPEWSKEEWCTDRMKRVENVDRISKPILEWMNDKKKEDVFRKGQALSVPVAPINSSKEVVESPQFNARKFFVEMEHPVAGKINKFPSSPYRFSKTPWDIDRPAPLLGEHNEIIFGKRLGLSKEELENLKKSGII